MLSPPAKYFPFATGHYDVRPGLRPLGTDFGNGPADARLFQLDTEFFAFRSAKLDARREQLPRHVVQDEDFEQVAGGIVEFLVDRLTLEHPHFFTRHGEAGDRRLECRLTGETLHFDQRWRLDTKRTRSDVQPRYVSALDALACQVQEEFAVTRADGNRNWIAALHVCLPSHWRPAEKLGLDFATVHAPVPGMEPFLPAQQKLVNAMLSATGGLVRFVWGLQWTDQWNRHPDVCSPDERFTPETPNARVRVERQTLWGFPKQHASLFTIRPYLIDARDVRNDRPLARGLADAVRSMSDDSLRYKALRRDRDAFLAWLESADD